MSRKLLEVTYLTSFFQHHFATEPSLQECEPGSERPCNIEEHGVCIVRAEWEQLLRNVRWKANHIIVGDMCEYHPDLKWGRCKITTAASTTSLSAVPYVAPVVSWPSVASHELVRKDKCSKWYQYDSASARRAADGFSQTSYLQSCDVFIYGDDEACAVKVFQQLPPSSVLCVYEPSKLVHLLHKRPKVVSVPFILVTAFHMAMMFPRKPDDCPEPHCFKSQPWANVKIKWIDHPMLQRWFTTGLVISHHKIQGMPIGGDDSMPDVDEAIIAKLRRTSKDGLLHAVFCVDHNPKRSRLLRQAVSIQGGCKQIVSTPMREACRISANTRPELAGQKEAQFKWLKELARYKFVLCPPGTGEDSFRVWQALHVGAFPIVLENPAFPAWSDVWDGLPVVRLKQAEDLTLSRLEEEFLNLTSRNTFQWEQSSPAFWVNQIRKRKDAISRGVLTSDANTDL